LENQPNGVAGTYGVGIPYELAHYGPSYRALVDAVVKALNVHILNLANEAVKNGQETDYHNGLIHRIRDNPAGASFLRASMLPSVFRFELDRLLAQPPPVKQSTTTAGGVEVADQLHLAIQWPDGHQGHSDNRWIVLVFPLHSGSCGKTPLADNVTIDIDGRMYVVL
jgi:hypothetical protein